MAKKQITTELVRSLSSQPPEKVTDYRHPKLPGFVLRARPSGVHSWRVQLPNRVWLSLGRLDEVSLADARQAAQEARARAALGEPVVRSSSVSAMTLRTFLDEHYAPWATAVHRGKSSRVTRLVSSFGGLLDMPLQDLRTEQLERWRSTRTSRRPTKQMRDDGRPRPVSGATINRDLAGLQSALARAQEWGLLAANPVRPMKRRVEDERAVVRYLSGDEERRLRHALEERDGQRRRARSSANEWRLERGYDQRSAHREYTDHLSPVVLLALNTGLRRGELLQLRWEDVSLTTRILTVRGTHAKSGQTRHVPLNSEAVETLQRWAAQLPSAVGFIFPGSSSQQPVGDIKNAWAGLLRRASITKFRFHDLRHTFASKLVMAGVDLNTVRELLGHADLTMTLRYAHLAPEHKAAAVEKLLLAP